MTPDDEWPLCPTCEVPHDPERPATMLCAAAMLRAACDELRRVVGESLRRLLGKVGL